MSRSGLATAFLFLLCLSTIYCSDACGFLRVNGDRIVDSQNQPFSLKGFNVEFKDFRSGSLTEDAVKKIAWTGATSLRLALNYQDFESTPFRYKRDSALLLDRILKWCEKHGVYVILDMHLAPGIQNLHDFVVHREKASDFWDNRTYRERFYALWSYLAKRYAEKRIIAAYDILNEGTPHTVTQYREVLTAAAKKIRLHDRKHILIIQEAFLPEGRKELVLIDDPNTAYSVHFFYPAQFSFYVTTTERTIPRYPGPMVTAGAVVAESPSDTITGTSGWRMITLNSIAPDGARIMKVRITSEGNAGTVWLDDLELAVDGRRLDLPALLVSNSSFEVDYPGLTWNSSSPCASVAEGTARTGRRSLALSRCDTPVSVESSPLPVESAKPYVLTAWYRAEGATGASRLSLSWHDEKTLEPITRAELLQKLEYALRFKKLHKVPLFIGEFTAHLNPSAESIRNYLTDLLDIFEAEGLHWSFWEFYSVYSGVGIFTGNKPYLVNPTAWDVLKRYLLR